MSLGSSIIEIMKGEELFIMCNYGCAVIFTLQYLTEFTKRQGFLHRFFMSSCCVVFIDL